MQPNSHLGHCMAGCISVNIYEARYKWDLLFGNMAYLFPFVHYIIMNQDYYKHKNNLNFFRFSGGGIQNFFSKRLSPRFFIFLCVPIFLHTALVFFVIFQNEITTILTPSTSERWSGGGGGCHVFSFWRSLITNPQC